MIHEKSVICLKKKTEISCSILLYVIYEYIKITF